MAIKKIAVLGLGNIGSLVAMLLDNADFKITAIGFLYIAIDNNTLA